MKKMNAKIVVKSSKPKGTTSARKNMRAKKVVIKKVIKK